MDNYVDCWYHGEDGLRLYARDYPCTDTDNDHPATVLCMHGLTRNSADFSGLADHLCERYRVLSVDQRGRGRSDYDPVTANYTPATYVTDMFTLLDRLDVAQVILVGTSMGGLMSFLMAVTQPQRIRAMVINDIGPELDPRGVQRIKSYVGKSSPVSNWEEAIAQCRSINEIAFPDFTQEQWLDFARGVYREEDGVPVMAYDPAIAQPMESEESGAIPADLWPVFEAVGTMPFLLLRGETSDILARDCVEKMQRLKPDMQFVEVPHRGHAPTLTEPTSLVAIDAFLAQLSDWPAGS